MILLLIGLIAQADCSAPTHALDSIYSRISETSLTLVTAVELVEFAYRVIDASPGCPDTGKLEDLAFTLSEARDRMEGTP